MFVVDWLHKQAQHHPDKLALVDVASGRSFRYRDFDERASRFAEWLREHWRLAPGDRLAVLAHNGSDYLEMLYGCAKAGVVMVCLNWRLPAAELQPIVDDAAPAAFVCSEELVAVGPSGWPGAPPLVGRPAPPRPAPHPPAPPPPSTAAGTRGRSAARTRSSSRCTPCRTGATWGTCGSGASTP